MKNADVKRISRERYIERLHAADRKAAAAEAEAARLQKLFDDAGQGEHNVLALVESYQSSLFAEEEKVGAVIAILERNGCDCDCEHDHESHDSDCERCLACRIAEALNP